MQLIDFARKVPEEVRVLFGQILAGDLVWQRLSTLR